MPRSLADGDIATIRSSLLAFHDATARPLPWRTTSDPYAIWVSEVMSQQTRVETVVPYYDRWLRAFPDVAALASASIDEVLKAWEGLGYYSRARNMHAAAQVVRERYHGTLPDTHDELRSLPGVGEYTAGAISSIAFGKREPAVDGNVRRVLARVLDQPEPSPSLLRDTAMALVPADRPGDFNQALMELGATVCTPRSPSCGRCPIASVCTAHANGTQAERPRTRPKKVVPKFDIAVAVLRASDGRVLLEQRPDTGLLAQMWCFPGEEVNEMEQIAATARLVAERFSSEHSEPRGLGSIDHTFSHRHERYHCFMIDAVPAHDALPNAVWVDAADRTLALPRAQQRIRRMAFANAVAIAIAAAGLTLSAACAVSPHDEVRDGSGLRRAVLDAAPNSTITLLPGHYVLDPVEYMDPACGNCQDATETVPATLGLRISGSGIRLVGTHRDSVVIDTRAGYGLLFEDCQDCELRGVTITGGARDPDGRATNAAVVIRRSTLSIGDCMIRDNIGDSATVAATIVGISGIAVREDGDVTVSGCEIIRNSWDGIAMYRGARAHVHDNIIDGVDKASGGNIGGGRGVGIGMTWDARATVERNRVTRYWKGIGVFVEAEAAVRENVVEDILTWGIALWGPDGATPAARIERNIVYGTGACGVMIDLVDAGPDPGTLMHNLVMKTGQNERYDSGEPYCWQRPVARHRVPETFVEGGNVLVGNRQPVDAGSAPPPVIEESAVTDAATALMAELRRYRALAGSAVFREVVRD